MAWRGVEGSGGWGAALAAASNAIAVLVARWLNASPSRGVREGLDPSCIEEQEGTCSSCRLLLWPRRRNHQVPAAVGQAPYRIALVCARTARCPHPAPPRARFVRARGGRDQVQSSRPARRKRAAHRLVMGWLGLASWCALTTVCSALDSAPCALLVSPVGHASALVSLSWQPVMRMPTCQARVHVGRRMTWV